jgi:hypothetical protein
LIPADGIGREVIPVSAVVKILLLSIVTFFPGRTQNIGSFGI